MHEAFLRTASRSGKLAVLVATLCCASCDAPRPTGQVIAVVDGQEITRRELQQESRTTGENWNGGSLPGASEQLVARKVMAREAILRGLDKTESYHFALRQTRDGLLAEALRAEMVASQREISETDVGAHIAGSPARFTARTLVMLQAAESATGLLNLDTATVGDALAAALVSGRVGSQIRVDGIDWIIMQKRPVTESVEAARARAKAEIRDGMVARELTDLVEDYRLRGKVVYQAGFGPAEVPHKGGKSPEEQ